MGGLVGVMAGGMVGGLVCGMVYGIVGGMGIGGRVRTRGTPPPTTTPSCVQTTSDPSRRGARLNASRRRAATAPCGGHMHVMRCEWGPHHQCGR